MADLAIPDISEFQGAPDLTGLQAVIIRAHNGYRPDNTFAANRANAHQAGCKVVGLYQYVLAFTDPAAQARLLLETVGQLQPGEFLIADIEESASNDADESVRYAAWRAVASTVSPVTWCYSGLSFSRAHRLQPDWMAAYQGVEPSGTHVLWQNTDAAPWKWGRSDGSVFHGTIDQLAALVAAPKPTPPAPIPPQPKENDMALANDGHAQYIVTVDSSGKLRKNGLPKANVGLIAAGGTPNWGFQPDLLAAIPNAG